jgi:hypothetical protein
MQRDQRLVATSFLFGAQGRSAARERREPPLGIRGKRRPSGWVRKACTSLPPTCWPRHQDALEVDAIRWDTGG